MCAPSHCLLPSLALASQQASWRLTGAVALLLPDPQELLVTSQHEPKLLPAPPVCWGCALDALSQGSWEPETYTCMGRSDSWLQASLGPRGHPAVPASTAAALPFLAVCG